MKGEAIMTQEITHEITLREFTQLSKFEDTEVTLWEYTGNNEESLFCGRIGDIPDDLLDKAVANWDLTEGVLEVEIEL